MHVWKPTFLVFNTPHTTDCMAKKYHAYTPPHASTALSCEKHGTPSLDDPININVGSEWWDNHYHAGQDRHLSRSSLPILMASNIAPSWVKYKLMMAGLPVVMEMDLVILSPITVVRPKPKIPRLKEPLVKMCICGRA